MRFILQLFILCIILTILNTTNSVAGDKIQFDRQKISFEKLSNDWKTIDGGSSAFFHAKRNPPVAKLWVRVSEIEPKDTRTQEESAMSWLKIMESNYPWNNLKIIEDGWASLDGTKAYWLIEEHKWQGKTPIKQKIYRIHINGNGYLLQFLTKSENFDKVVDDFDNWVQTIKFLE